METFLTIVHYVVCIFLIVVILLQAGKGADIGAAFGAGSSQTVFGPRGAATFLTKLTAVVAVVFVITSVSLAQYAKGRAGGTVFERIPTAPSSPETTPSLPPETQP